MGLGTEGRPVLAVGIVVCMRAGWRKGAHGVWEDEE